MPYDEDGNWVDPEETDQELDTEGTPVGTSSDIAEYLRRANLQSQMSGNGSVEYKQPVIGPAETRFRQLQSQEPLKENFRPSGLRKVLGTLAGAASGNPGVRDSIINSQYNKAQGNFQQKLGVQGSQAQEEEAATQRAAVQGHLGAQSEAEVARRKAEEARGARYQWMISPEGQKFELDKTRLQHPGTAPKAEEGPYEAELNDGTVVNLVRTPAGLWKNPETGELVQRSVIKKVSEKGKGIKDSSPYTGVLKEDVAAHQVIAEEIAKPGTHAPFEVDAAKAYIKSRTEGRDPNDSFNVVVRTMEDEGKGKGKNGKLTSDQMIKLRNMMPEQKPPQTLLQSPSGELIRGAPGVVVPPGTTTPQQAGTEAMGTAATRTMKETAPKVVALADKVLSEVEQQKSSLGPSASRWNEFWAGKVGAPNPEFTQLRTNTALLQTLLMRMHVGASGRVAMMQHFQDLFDVGKQSPENMAAAVSDIKDYANEIAGTKPPGTPIGNTLPKIGDRFEGSKVKSIKQIK